MLTQQLLDILRTYWRLARPKHWMFPGRDASQLSARSKRKRSDDGRS